MVSFCDNIVFCLPHLLGCVRCEFVFAKIAYSIPDARDIFVAWPPCGKFAFTLACGMNVYVRMYIGS